MTADVPGERVIEIDAQSDYAQVAPRRPVPRYVPLFVALALGFLIGLAAADVIWRKDSRPAPAVSMHTVVVTEDGRSQTFTMPSGSLVTTPAVKHSCSITVDGKFVDFISAVVGNAECGATVR